MEEKLRQYRARRRRQEFIEKTTDNLEKAKRRFVDLYRKMIKINVEEEFDIAPVFKEPPSKDQVKNKTSLEVQEYDENNKNVDNIKEEQKLVEKDSEAEEELVEEAPPKSWQYIIIKWLFYCIIWFTLFFYFVTLQFGAVFFAISLLIGIYLNTGTRPRRKGEASAYSVFNENCESIDGTVTAEKLQKEMFFGSFRLF